MELLECPGCNGFVRRDWEACRSCGIALTLDGAGIETPEPETESRDETTEEVVLQEVVSEPSKPVAPAAQVPPTAPVIAAPEPSKRLRLPDFVDVNEPVTAPTIEPEQPEPVVAHVAEPQADIAEADTDTDESLRDRLVESAPPTRASDALRAVVPSKKTLIGVSTIALLTLCGLGLFTAGSAIDETSDRTDDATNSAMPADSWIRFDDANAWFAVDVPTPPAVSDGSVDNNRSTLTASDTHDKTATVSIRITESKQAWSKEDKILTDALGRQAARSSSKVANQLVARNVDRRQLDATLKSPEEQSIFRAWVSGNYLIEVLVVSRNDESQPELFTRFADSLEVKV